MSESIKTDLEEKIEGRTVELAHCLMMNVGAQGLHSTSLQWQAQNAIGVTPIDADLATRIWRSLVHLFIFEPQFAAPLPFI